MKKTIVLVLIAALVAVAPVSAAGLDFGGSIETKIEVNKKEGQEVTVTPGSELTLDLGINAAQDTIRAGVEFGLEKEDDKELMPSDITLGDIKLKQAFIEADGAFWHGGPEATTRFGTLDIRYSPYASLKGHNGISISGVDLDVLGLNAFYANTGEHVVGLRSDLYLLDDVAVGASVIADSEITRIQADAAANPIEGLNLAGSIAVDHEDKLSFNMNNLWKVQAEYELVENTNIVAGYKHITQGFDPKYVADKTKNEDAEHDWVKIERAKDSGLFVGFDTEQQGVNLHAAYDQMFAEASVGAGTEYEGFRFEAETVLSVPAMSQIATKSTTFGVGREFEVMEGLAIDTKYEGKWAGSGSKLQHTLGASTTLGLVPAINGLELSAEVSASELNLDSVGYKVGAEFAAPNGVNLGIEHARYDGTTFNAGMKVEF